MSWLVLLVGTALAGSAAPSTGQETATVLQERRTAAEARSAQAAELLAWGDALLGAVVAGQKLSPSRDIKPCVKALERGAESRPEAAAALRSKAAEILAKTGSPSAALDQARAAVQAELTVGTLSLLISLQKQVDPTQMGSTCASVRSTLRDDAPRLLLLQRCLEAVAPTPFPAGLSWAPSEDIAFYQAYLDQLDQKEAAERAAREETQRRAAMLVAPQNGPGNRRVTEVTGRITCSGGVRLFKGTARGTGTYTWYYPKDNLAYSIREGDQLCLCDAKDQRNTCWTATGTPAASLVLSCEAIQAE
jgi:hypothetical protein